MVIIIFRSKTKHFQTQIYLSKMDNPDNHNKLNSNFKFLNRLHCECEKNHYQINSSFQLKKYYLEGIYIDHTPYPYEISLDSSNLVKSMFSDEN